MEHKNQEENIKILHWNANGVAKSKLELSDLLHKEKIHIALISETHLKERKKFNISNYNTIRTDRTNRPKGGTAIIIRNDINFSSTPISGLNQLEATAIKIKLTQNRSVTIAACYNPPQQKQKTIKPEELDIIFGSDHSVIAAGDFNSKHNLWNSRKINPNGQILYEYVLRKNIFAIGTSQPTHYPYSFPQNPDILDIALIQNLPHPAFQTVLHELNSDHRPVLLTLKTAISLYFGFKKCSFAVCCSTSFSSIVMSVPFGNLDSSSIKDKMLMGLSAIISKIS